MRTTTMHVFITRFWEEQGDDGTSKWRGVLIHVDTGERIPLRSVEEVLEWIQTFLKSHDQPSE